MYTDDDAKKIMPSKKVLLSFVSDYESQNSFFKIFNEPKTDRGAKGKFAAINKQLHQQMPYVFAKVSVNEILEKEQIVTFSSEDIDNLKKWQEQAAKMLTDHNQLYQKSNKELIEKACKLLPVMDKMPISPKPLLPLSVIGVVHDKEDVVKKLSVYSYSLQQACNWFQESEILTAVAYYKFNLLKVLIGRYHSLDIANENGITPLMLAYDNNEVLNLLLKGYSLKRNGTSTAVTPNVNYVNCDGVTALMFAARFGYLENVKLLCQFQADVNIKDKYGNSALAYALQAGHINIVKFLLQQKATVDGSFMPIAATELLKTVDVATAPQRAIYLSLHYPLINLLWRQGRATKIINPEIAPQKLLFKALMEVLPLEELLLFIPEDINYEDEYGDTCLFAAINSNSLPLVKAIVAYKADVNYTSKIKQENALQLAFNNNQEEIFNYLLPFARPSSLEFISKYNITELTHLNPKLLVFYLQQHGAKISSIDKIMLLEVGILNRSMELIEVAILSGIDYKVVLSNGFTPIFIAMHNNDLELLQKLVTCGFDVHQTLEELSGYNSITNKKEILTIILLSSKIDAGKLSDAGGKLLAFSIANGWFEIAEDLINANANVNYGEDGGSVFSIAVASGNLKILKLLLKKQVQPSLLTGGNVILLAAQSKDIELFQDLIRLEIKDHNYDALSYVLNMALIGNNEYVDFLLVYLDCKTRINLYNEDAISGTLLRWCLQYDPEKIPLLIESGINKEVLLDNGKSAAEFAVENNLNSSFNYVVEHQLSTNNALITAFNKDKRNQQWFYSSKLIASDIDFEEEDKAKMLLHLAEHKKQTLAIELIRKGCNLNYHDSRGLTPLHWCAINNLSNLGIMLLQQKIEVEQKDINGYSAIYYAVKNNSKEFLQHAVNMQGYKVDLKNTSEAVKQSPLTLAIKEQRWEIAILIARQCNNTDAPNFYSETALGLAIYYYSSKHKHESQILDLINILLQQGANPNQKFIEAANHTNLRSDNLLMAAARNGYDKIVDLLLRYGADHSIINSRSSSSAAAIAKSNNHSEIVAKLKWHQWKYRIKKFFLSSTVAIGVSLMISAIFGFEFEIIAFAAVTTFLVSWLLQWRFFYLSKADALRAVIGVATLSIAAFIVLFPQLLQQLRVADLLTTWLQSFGLNKAAALGVESAVIAASSLAVAAVFCLLVPLIVKTFKNKVVSPLGLEVKKLQQQALQSRNMVKVTQQQASSLPKKRAALH